MDMKTPGRVFLTKRIIIPVHQSKPIAKRNNWKYIYADFLEKEIVVETYCECLHQAG